MRASKRCSSVQVPLKRCSSVSPCTFNEPSHCQPAASPRAPFGDVAENFNAAQFSFGTASVLLTGGPLEMGLTSRGMH